MSLRTFRQRHPIGFYISLTSIVLLLSAIVVVRLYLDVWVLDYVNNVLANLNGYKGSVQSISIDLYRGAYRINKLDIRKTGGKIPAPFVAIETADLSIQWSALFDGRIVSSLDLDKPVINFAVNKGTTQNGKEQDWTKPIKDLAPIDINKVTFRDGVITYQDFGSTPQVNVYVHQLRGTVTNLRNVVDKAEPLPSTVDAQGSSVGGGHLSITGRMNILKPTPDMKLKIALENASLVAFNNYTEAYASFDFKQGTFNLYSQVNIIDNHVAGYIKPLVTDLSIDILKEPNPIDVVWRSLVSAVMTVFTNLPKDQFATRTDLDGQLGSIQTDTWSTVWGIIYNAFIQAMTKGFDQTSSKDAVPQKEE